MESRLINKHRDSEDLSDSDSEQTIDQLAEGVHEFQIENPKTLRKIIFFTPFPDLSETEFKKMTAKKNNVSFNGFAFKVSTDKVYDYSMYSKQFNELVNEFAQNHKKSLEKSSKRAHDEIDVEILTLPKTAEELAILKEKIGNLEAGDELYINSHGNADVVGIRPLSLYAKNLSDLLIQLKLPNKRLLIAVWACNSGYEPDGTNSYAQKLYNALEKRKRNKLYTVGVNGYLYGSKEGSFATKEQRNETNKRRDGKKLATDQALNFSGTPDAKKINSETKKMGFFSALRDTAEHQKAKAIKSAEKKLRSSSHSQEFNQVAKALFLDEDNEYSPLMTKSNDRFFTQTQKSSNSALNPSKITPKYKKKS